MENKKYKLLKEDSITVPDGYIQRTLYRIQAVTSFEDIQAGDLGGYVESEKNLSHLGGCWIYDEAYCYNNGRVIEEAWIAHFAEVRDNAVVSGEAWVEGDSIIEGESHVTGSAWVTGFSVLKGKDKVEGTSMLGHQPRKRRKETDIEYSMREGEFDND